MARKDDDEAEVRVAMKVLVTGASGFIGSYVSRQLAALGHDVLVLSREPEPWRLADLRASIALVRGDLDDQEAWFDQLRAFAPDAVAHLGWAGVGNFDRNNFAQARNIGWTTELLERSAHCGARVFVGVGSQAEYGFNLNSQGMERPTTLYGEAKLAAGRMAAQYSIHLNMRFAWARIFSIYGPTDHPYWMVPSLIRDLLSGKTPALTKGEQRWDFLHVEDACHAICMLLENDAASGVFPLGSGDAPTLRSSIEALRDAIDPKLPLGFGEIAYRPDQVMHLQADVGRLRDLGWLPTVPLSRGLAETVGWYRANRWIFP